MITIKDSKFGYCEEAQTYCSIAEEVYNKIREYAIKECIGEVKEYFLTLLEMHPEWDADSIDNYVLTPNADICKILKGLISN